MLLSSARFLSDVALFLSFKTQSSCVRVKPSEAPRSILRRPSHENLRKKSYLLVHLLLGNAGLLLNIKALTHSMMTLFLLIELLSQFEHLHGKLVGTLTSYSSYFHGFYQGMQLVRCLQLRLQL